MIMWKGLQNHQRALIFNFNYLAVLQVFQLVLPLITYPYLIRVLGAELYGVVAFANAVVVYFNVFIDFGFNISEIREISVNRDDLSQVSKTVSTVIVAKLLLTLVAFVALFALVFFVPALKAHRWLYLASLGMLLDTALNPRFYFQAVEKMKFITLLNVGARLLFLVMIFVAVKAPEDYVLVPLLTSIGAVLSSLLGLAIMGLHYRVRFKLPSLSGLKQALVNSLPFFGSRVSVLAINKTNVVLIGSFLGYTEVAYYDLAEKLVSVMKMPFNIFNQVLYPNVSKTKNVALVVKTIRFLLGAYVLGYFLVYLGGGWAIEKLAGGDLLPAFPVLRILGVSALTELVSVFLGAPMLLAMGYKNEFNASIIWGSLFYLTWVVFLWLFGSLGLYSLTFSTVASSSFVMIYRLFYCRKYKLL